MKEGFNAKSIRMVLDEKARKHGGMFWRYWKQPEEQVPDSPEVAIPLLTEALRRDELDRMRREIYHDEVRNQWGVRLAGRTVFQPTRPEAVALWYRENAQPQVDTLPMPERCRTSCRAGPLAHTPGTTYR